MLLACASQPPRAVSIGASEATVVDVLGVPDKKAFLEGKLLREIAEGDSIPADRLIVFIYERSQVRVWLKDGKVTGMTRNGIAIDRL